MYAVDPFKCHLRPDRQLGNFKRALHGNALFGARIIKESMLLEPSVWVNYSVVNRLNVNLSFRIEQFDSFWAGLTYTTNQTPCPAGGIDI
jgi:hypothetical protein